MSSSFQSAAVTPTIDSPGTGDIPRIGCKTASLHSSAACKIDLHGSHAEPPFHMFKPFPNNTIPFPVSNYSGCQLL